MAYSKWDLNSGIAGGKVTGWEIQKAILNQQLRKAEAENKASEYAQKHRESVDYAYPYSVENRAKEEQLAGAQSSRNMAEQQAYQKNLNNQWMPSSGFGGGSGKNRLGQATEGTGTTSDDFKAPVYDEQKVESLAQRAAAPGIRRLRDQVQQVQGGVYDNPNVKSMTLRSALAGYGSGLEDVMGGALTSATGMYNQQYQPQFQAAQLSYQARQTREQNALDREMEQKRLDAQYQNAWNAWMAKNQA